MVDMAAFTFRCRGIIMGKHLVMVITFLITSVVVIGFSVTAQQKVNDKHFFDNPAAYLNLPEKEEVNILSLFDSQLIKLKAFSYLAATELDTVADSFVMVFDHIRTEREIDFYIVFDYLDDKSGYGEGNILNINFIVKVGSKDRVIRYYPHEFLPHNRFSLVKFDKEEFMNNYVRHTPK